MTNMKRWQLRLPAIAISLLLAGLFSAGLAAASPTGGASVAQAEAIAKPSLVFIRTQWHGFLVNAYYHDVNIADMLSGSSGSAPEFTVSTTCSGFIASPGGDVVTAGHCVDNQSMRSGGRGLIVRAAVAELARLANLRPALARSVLDYGYSNWTVEGQDKNSPPDRAVSVYQAEAASGISVSTPMQANVVDVQPFNNGDVALLKVESSTPMPAIQVAPSAPTNGTQVVALGFPGSVSDTVDPSTEPSMKDGTISGTRTISGVPFIEMSAATSPGMSGGPVVDLQGRVVGTVSWSPGAETQAFNFMSATSSVREILASNSIRTALSPTDQAYRAGLTDYFAGKYHDAVKQFDQVLQMEPGHAMAQEYKRLAITKYPLEKSTSSNTWLYIGLAGGAVVVALAVGLLLVLRKRRGGGAPHVTAATSPAMGGPGAGAVTPPSAAPSTAGVPTPKAYPTASPAPAGAGSPPTGRSEASATGDAESAHPGMYCPFCGERHDADAHFCAACGFHFPASQKAGDSS